MMIIIIIMMMMIMMMIIIIMTYDDLWGFMMTSVFLANTCCGRYEIEAMAFQRPLPLLRILKKIQPMCEHVESIEQICSSGSAHS